MDTAHKSVEKFMAVSKRLYQDSQQENRFSSFEEKELCRAIKKLFEGAQQGQAGSFDGAVEKIMMKSISSRESDDLLDCCARGNANRNKQRILCRPVLSKAETG